MKTLYVLISLLLTTSMAFPQLEHTYIAEGFKSPESVAYDPIRDIIYVSNYNKDVENGTSYGEDYVSKVSKSGEIIKFDWIDNLSAPTGIIVANDKLYIVERFGIVEYDLKKDTITNKYCIQFNEFINDITMGPDGAL
ncbi:MAG: hypothetical protein IH948_06780, partial [Bacteroidetes bacterium]|nr:hypothetical protein [Bacteroidota bacterium]